MRVQKSSLAASLGLLFVAACGGNAGKQQPDAGTGAYKLALVGNALLTVHPGEKRALSVVLAQDQVGPVANAHLQFDFGDGDPQGSRVEVNDVTTGVDGVATVHFTAGVHTTTFKLVASAPAYPDVSPVAFSFNVIPVRRLLQIVGAPGTVVDPDGQSAHVAMYVSSSVGLKVRELDQDTGAPIAGDTLTFSLPAASHATFSGANARSATATTGAAGEGQIFLLSTSTLENLLVVGQSAAGGAAVDFNVAVQATASSSCTSSQQCAAGQICVAGKCQDSGGGTCGNGSDNSCPFGYQCVGGVCQPPSAGSCDPGTQNCPSGQSCQCSSSSDPSTCQCKDICPVCTEGTHCDPGSHDCIPNPGTLPDVSGVWYTKHIFSIHDALPTALQDIFKALRILDQLVSGQLGLPSWLQSIIDAIIKQYIPDWVLTIIHIGDDIGTILSSLRSEGAMRLAQDGNAKVQGTEVWTSLVFYWLPLCNGQIAGDPDVPPECARFDVATTDSDNPGDTGQCKGQSLPSITVKVAPFNGAVAALGSNNGAPFQFQVAPRKVDVKMGKVVLVVIDQLLALTTPWHCIDEATDCANGNACIVDCAGLAAWIDNVTGGFLPAPTLEGVCDQAVTTIGRTVSNLLATISFTTDIIDFSGHSSIAVGSDQTSCTSGLSQPCASQLGNDNFDRDLRKNPGARDGFWTGKFFRLIGGMPGAFEGKRDPLH